MEVRLSFKQVFWKAFSQKKRVICDKIPSIIAQVKRKIISVKGSTEAKKKNPVKNGNPNPVQLYFTDIFKFEKYMNLT